MSLGSVMTTRLPSRRTICPGTPTIVELAGTLRSTTEPAPTRQLSPMVMLPICSWPLPTDTMIWTVSVNGVTLTSRPWAANAPDSAGTKVTALLTEAIKEHHQERLQHLVEVGAALGPSSVRTFSEHLFAKRNWGMMATSETYAHLEHLRQANRARRFLRGGDLVYALEAEG